ncbi:hypothetical protein J7T55_004818 [Diaporthe amygdali]|uniref:uncharacterized protein n=1 Tax=Phomopsis amygdali TaxID=1214568 RepID=UPI0022FE68F8|nr:uncharacterized protein J7T55_004818 [Diaporthe amygdali]KAJ0114574.1 hypothetical protein J7T55_004818 [Diaporthe amygdali]
MSRPANGLPSQAGLGDNSAPDPTANPLLSRDNITSNSQDHLDSHRSRPSQKRSSSNSDSQATILSSDESNRVFTPPMIETAASDGGPGSGQGSSQESQLFQLSQLAAAQDKLPGQAQPLRSAVKRTADGTIKDPRFSPTASPGRGVSHSRNTSAVSAASTASSRVTELSSELKTRLSYALLKVNNGWESRNINQVETLASRGVSPVSSNSTIPGAPRSSASPRIQTSHAPTPLTPHAASLPITAPENASQGPPASPASHPANIQLLDIPSLAPPVSIQPHHSEGNPRRNPNPKHPPNFPPPQPHHASPRTPSLASLNLSPDPRGLLNAGDPMVVSPTHNNREKDAMEALLFMSSPGNSANLKQFPRDSQPLERVRNGASAAFASQRTALPTSAPKRKSLPNGRPTHSSQPLPTAHSPKKRVGFGKSHSTLSEMEIDDPTSPRRHAGYARPAAPPRKANGTAVDMLPPHGKFAVPLTSASGRPTRPKPRIRSYEDLDAMLDRVAAEASSSDSDDEIDLSVSSRRREGSAGMRG